MKIPAFSKHTMVERFWIFFGVSLERGQIYAVIGANGSGKSAFSQILSGILSAN